MEKLSDMKYALVLLQWIFKNLKKGLTKVNPYAIINIESKKERKIK